MLFVVAIPSYENSNVVMVVEDCIKTVPACIVEVNVVESFSILFDCDSVFI